MDENAEEYKQKIAQIEKLGRKLVKLSRRIKAVMEADIDCDEMDKWGNLYLQVISRYVWLKRCFLPYSVAMTLL